MTILYATKQSARENFHIKTKLQSRRESKKINRSVKTTTTMRFHYRAILSRYFVSFSFNSDTSAPQSSLLTFIIRIKFLPKWNEKETYKSMKKSREKK